MQLHPRSVCVATARGVRDRPRHRFVRGAQPSAPPIARGAVVQSANWPATTGLVSGRCPSGHRRTVVRPADPRVHRPGLGSGTPAVAASNRLVRLVIHYQRAVDGRPSPCRFTPSCSAYAVEALSIHGTVRGFYLTLRRLLRCRPFGPSGWDPVPELAPFSRPPISQPHPHSETRKRVVAS